MANLLQNVASAVQGAVGPQVQQARLGMRANAVSTSPQVYYPALAVSLSIRFDEAFTKFSLPAPVAPDDVVASLGRAATAFVGNGLVATAQTIAGGVRQALSRAPSLFPSAVTGKADDLSQLLALTPKGASFELPSYRQAGKFSVTFEYRELPIDPRAYRAIAITIHSGAIDPANFAKGIGEVPPSGFARKSVLVPAPDKLRFAGFVDEVSVEFSESKSLVTLEGRDYRGYLLDTPLYPGQLEAVDITKPINDVVNQILALYPFYATVTAIAQPEDWPGGVIPTCAGADDLCRVNRRASGTAALHGLQGETQSLKLWDVITRYCYLVGAIPYFDGFQLKIRPARSIYDIQKEAGIDPRVPTPFASGKPRLLPTETGLVATNIRTMVYGRDIQKLSLQRKLTGVKVPSVEVVGLDTSSAQRGKGKIITVRFPPTKDTQDSAALEAARTTNVAPSGESSQNDVLRVPVAGIRNPQILLQIAQNIHEEIGRLGDIGGSVRTRNLASYGGDNSDPDLLGLKPGDPIKIEIDARHLGASPLVSELTDHVRRSDADELKVLTQRLGDPVLARVLLTISRNAVPFMQDTFRVGNVRFTWDSDRGLDVEFDFQNYVEVRYNPDAIKQTLGPNQHAPVAKATPHVGPANPSKVPPAPSPPTPPQPSLVSIPGAATTLAPVPLTLGGG